MIPDKNNIYDKTSKIDVNHVLSLDNIYINYINNIKKLINTKKYICDIALELFQNEWKNMRKELSYILEDLITKPYLYVPFNLEDMIEGILYL